MSGEPKRTGHPIIVYVIGFFFAVVTIAVTLGVVNHFALSHHGPAILKPLMEKYVKEEKSAILEEAIKIEEQEVHRHFHNIAPYSQLPENERPVCFICHSELPHSKNKKIRSLLNMHTQFFVCETCHIENKDGQSIVFKWYNPFEQNPKGPFLGTDYDPETGILIKVNDKYSKVTPFFMQDNKFESAIQIQDAPLAKDFVKVRDKLSPEQRDGVKRKFHVNIKPKGNECKVCHTKDSVLDFKGLGFSEKRVIDLQQLNISGMITKYEEFYLPDLYKD